jgi:hypothetical protein
MQPEFTDNDEGKAVVDTAGERIGIISKVREGTAFVTPRAGVGERIKTKLGWGTVEDDSYPLMDEAVEAVTDDEIRVQRE